MTSTGLITEVDLKDYRPQILDPGVSSGITLTIVSDLTWKITVFTNEIENSQLLTNLP